MKLPSLSRQYTSRNNIFFQSTLLNFMVEMYSICCEGIGITKSIMRQSLDFSNYNVFFQTGPQTGTWIHTQITCQSHFWTVKIIFSILFTFFSIILPVKLPKHFLHFWCTFSVKTDEKKLEVFIGISTCKPVLSLYCRLLK